ncbi:MAG: anti-sigma factor [Sphingomicrobium sp.]
MNSEEGNVLAAEYAIGLLVGQELQRARALASSDPGFAAEVAGWSGHLAQLLDSVEPVQPPARVLAAVKQAISEPPQRADNVYTLRRRLNVWRGFTLGASAIAASLAVMLVTRPEPIEQVSPPSEPARPMVAMMSAEDSAARLVATWDPSARSLVVAAAAGVEAVADQSHELWVIPGDGTPRSMGLLPGAEPAHLRVAEPMAEYLSEGATLAVSVEPVGGSPTGQPTGPVIAAGALQRT